MKLIKQLSSLLLIGAGAFCSLSAHAEGSRSLYPASYEANYVTGGNADGGRANLTVSGTSVWMNVVPARSLIYVYAQAGEVILLGSRNRDSAGTGVVSVYSMPPGGFAGVKGNEDLSGLTAGFDCSAGTDGLIANRAEETYGPKQNAADPNGFVPCVWSVPATGIYGVRFSGTGGNGANASVATPALAQTGVSAWDVAVRDFSVTNPYGVSEKTGRVFTYAWAADTGGNGSGKRIYSSLYYVTDDGYRYRQQLVGIDPNAGVFYANAFGFRDQSEPLYKDIRGQNQTVSQFRPVGISGVTADGAQYPLFFSDITAGGSSVESTLTALGIPLAPKPPQVNSFKFSYPPANTSTSYVGQGGVFEFYVTDTMSFQIIISHDGVDWNPASGLNRVLTGTSGTGSYSVTWDGKNNNGANMGVGNYQFRISGRNGEVHFPFADVEGNRYGGPVITKLNGSSPGDPTVYYDDRGYVTKNGTAVGTLNGHICGSAYAQPTPNEALLGVDSSLRNQDNGSGPNTAYARWWPEGSNNNSDCAGAGQYFGDSKALNLWTYQTTQPQSNVLTVVDFADVKATVSAPVSVAPGASVSVGVAFGNVGSQIASGASYALQLRAGLGNLSCSGATCNYNPSTGVVTVTGLPASLSPGQWANLNVSYTAPASGNVPVMASVGTVTSQGDNLAPDSASAVTLVGTGNNAPDVMTTVAAPPSAVVGGTVTVPVTFANAGGTTATGVVYGMTLATGLNPAQVSCAGATCSYDAGTGVVTLTGLPNTLVAGQSLSVTVSYVAPATPVTVATSINAASDANAANNAASGTTTPSSSTGFADVVTSVTAPATTTPGAAVDVVVRFGNLGDATATGVTYSAQLPTGLSGVSCAQPAVCNYNAATGAVSVSGLPASLGAGIWTNMTLRYTAPTSGVVEVSSTVAAAAESNTANNTATGATTVSTASTGADVRTTVQPPAKVAPGATVNLPVTLSNVGPLTADNVTASLKLPAGLTGVACSGGVACSYNATTGNVTLTSGVPTQLTSGQSVAFSVAYTAPGVGSVPVEANIATTSFDPNSGNNKSTGSTEVTAGSSPDMTTTVSAPATGAGGGAVSVQVRYENAGGSQATSVGYNIALSGSPTGVEVRNNGALCTYDAGTGAVTGCGLPAVRNPGEAVNLVVTYTAPGSGSVGVTSTVSAAVDGNANNNTANGSTALSAAPDMAVSLAGLPITASQGVAYSGSFTCSNVGAQGAVGGTNCAVSGLPAGVAQGACTISPGATAWSAGAAVPAGQTVTCLVSGAPTATGAFTVTGSTGATSDMNAANNSATATLTVGVAPDVRVSTSGLPATATVGSSYSGTFTCSNTGSASAVSGTSCTISGLPAGVTQGACTVSPGASAWSAGSAIAVGATVTCQVSGVPTAAGSSTATASTGATNDADASNNTGLHTITVNSVVASPASIPTLGEWGLIILSALLGLLALGQRQRFTRG
ncbi:putative secreted protein (IPTL-CTERM system target) [Acidovorax sp. 62]|uniref:IPTL-CTERM sorting domain-containing protein n=1 Tax=Acidovorax sp. 62 TaxID=2035203 RepID=UPI000C18AFB6|nr:IPTL-CTERM sorting domain-containing protein [Acidovorax sp. 62]PIF89602.1 putative secreted protein (IPTL-CTERM system target) [Acidovorax sp. 62]